MRALAVIAILALLVTGALPDLVSAGDVIRSTVLPPNPFAMTPPPAPLQPQQTPVVKPPHGHPGHRPRPPAVSYGTVYYPSGYWAYQWVPTTYTTYVWVPGYVTAEGVMVSGGYHPQVVNSGYYQPVWIPY